MSDLIINMTSGSQSSQTLPGSRVNATINGKSLGNAKHQKFVRKRRFLERKGVLNGKQNNFKQNKGQSYPGHNKKHNHQGKPLWQNGSKLPTSSTATHNTLLPHFSGSGSNTSSGSKPEAPANSSASLTVTVSNTGNPEQERKAVSFSSTDHKARLTQSFAVSLPCGSTSIGNPTKYLAIDCEMVGTGPKGCNSQLARCSIVSYDGDVVYDKFIKPPMPVTDYRTRWSGIRWCDLVKATPYTDARKEILRLLMGKVVIGHAIHNDFKVLGYTHPAALTRDTSRFPLLNQKAGFGEKECASLKRLTKAIFNRDIQVGKKGHSSVEDAKATMELYKFVEVEWERTMASPPSSGAIEKRKDILP